MTSSRERTQTTETLVHSIGVRFTKVGLTPFGANHASALGSIL